MIKAAFFDIDGTLVSFRTHAVSPGTVRAFRMLRAKGVRTFIATGRPRCLLPDMPLEFDGHVLMNGGFCHMDGKVLYKNPIAADDSQQWLRYAEHNGICTMVFTADDMFSNRHDDRVAQALCEEIKIDMPPLLPPEEMLSLEAYQFIAVMEPDRDAEVREMLPHCRLPRWHPHFGDLINGCNSKAVGIEHLLRHMGLCREECICFGDGANDIEMLEYCGIGVAMGNADDIVKEHADHVTTTVDDEGIEKALHTLAII